MKDPYKILGVSKNATDEEIKKAYRELAKKYHPDLNPNNKEMEPKFKEVSVAYKLIENKEAREKFEQGILDEQATPSSDRSGTYYNDFQEDGGRYAYHYDGNPEDIFKAFFSGKGEGRGMDLPGKDHFFEMEIDLKDAIIGIEQEILLGEGKKLKIKIPPGIMDKEKLRIKNQGGQGIGLGKRGDAYIEILIRPSSMFQINGHNLEIEIPITLDEAVNGGSIKVPTIEETIMMTIPAGVNTGTKLRIKEKGMPIKNKGRGDQIVILKVMLPDNIDLAFKEFIKTWSKNHPYNPREMH